MYTKEALHNAEVQVSNILESYGFPDPYPWRFNKRGQVIPQHSDVPIEEIVLKRNLVEIAEYDALLKIQDHAFKINSGFILWISPIHPVYYPDASKIVISKKEGDLLLNWSIGTTWDTLGSIIAARELAKLSNLDPYIFKSATDVRANPIFIDKENEHLLSLIFQQILDPRSLQMMKSGEDLIIKEKFMKELLSGKSTPLGSSPRSCPPRQKGLTAFQIFSGKDEYGPLQFECPLCHKTNTRPPHELLSSCQHCGGNVRCNISA